MERKSYRKLFSTLFFVILFSLNVLAGTFTIEPGIYYQTNLIQVFSGYINETNQYGEDRGNYLSIIQDMNRTTFEWYGTSYDGYSYRKMSGTITRKADGSYSVVNDINDPNNDIVESCIESITPISDSEILVYSWGEGDGRWDDYYTMSRNSSASTTSQNKNSSTLNEYDPLLARVGNVYKCGNDQVTIMEDQGQVYLDILYCYYDSNTGKNNYTSEQLVLTRKTDSYGDGAYYKPIGYTKRGVEYFEDTDTLVIYSGKFGDEYTRYK